MLIALGEGGCQKNNTNLNELLFNYGMQFNSDSVVRTSYYKYLHPKECYIEDNKCVHPEFAKTIKNINKKRKIIQNEDLLDTNYTNGSAEDDGNIRFVYPFGCSIKPLSSVVSVVLSSGLISYPANQPLMICTISKSKRGRILIVGSESLFEDEFMEKEDNKRIIVR